MKVATRVLDVDSTLQGEKVGMTIDTTALAHIMSVLTDLYSDQEMAVIREYSTNAYDAHIEAGVSRPIEVTLPSALAPFFKVRDFGYGLDDDDIRDIYSRYGTSTKRQSDDVVGMLGLGCKSALSYTDQFTLRGIKNGVCTQVSVSRDEDGSGSMTILDQYPTEETSGVEIIVPSKRLNTFSTKAEKFFRFWEEGTVLVNSEAPKRVNGLWLADDLLMTDEVDRSMVVMGNVAYPLSDRYDRYHTVAFVPIGAVNFTPSREALQMNQQTKNTLEHIRDRVEKEKEVAIARLINEAPNRTEAIKVALAANKFGYNKPPLYKGQLIPINITKPDADLLPFVVVTGDRYRRAKGWSKEKTIQANTWVNGLWLTGYENDSFTPYKRQKLDQWFTVKGLKKPTYIILTKEVPIPEWVDPTTIHDWEEVQAQKIVRETQKRNDGRPTGSYEGYVAGTRANIIVAADIDTSKPIFYYEKNWGDSGKKIIDANYPDATIVVLGQNRINKFKRDFPTAKHMREHAKELGKKWVESLSKDDLWYIQISESGDRGNLSRFDAAKIDDPELKRIVTLSNTRNEALLSQKALYSGWLITYPEALPSPFSKYPLLTSSSMYDIMKEDFREQCYLYLNAAFAAKQEA